MIRHRYLKNVSTLSLDSNMCIGCNCCTIVCPHGVLEMDGGKARITDRDLCMECGACAMNCPANAITVSAGVGCASAIIRAALTGGEPSCCCSGGEDCC